MKENLGNLYECYYSKKGTQGYRLNGVFRVVAVGVIRAATICTDKYPGCTVWSVQHRGKVEFIDPTIGSDD